MCVCKEVKKSTNAESSLCIKKDADELTQYIRHSTFANDLFPIISENLLFFL